jgi:hypothetical protein
MCACVFLRACVRVLCGRMGIGVGSESTFPDWVALAYRGGGGGDGWWMRHTIQELVLASMHAFEPLFIALFPSLL